ncbi:MAG: epimerase, partial [Cyanobacteria bacterium P01_F01_bin.42]
QESGIPVPREIPEPVVRLAGALLDPIGRILRWQPPISRERVHYLYDRCVRVDAQKARQQLSWTPRSVESTLKELVQAAPRSI